MECKPLKKHYSISKDDQSLATLCKALGHEARVQIVRMLLEKNACVCGDFVDYLPISQSTVSQHLKVLKEAGIITGEIDGNKICYGLNTEKIKELRVLIASL
ncbi:MAG: metalloregulator ArsR/SmtB family transcription factor [Bacteriovoracaceae bacterium]